MFFIFRCYISFYSLFFLFTVFIFIFNSLSSSEWVFAWANMELTTFCLLPILLEGKKLLTTEASVKYFLVQSVAGMFILMAGNQSLMINSYTIFFHILFSCSLLLKVGAFPFHFWVVPVVSGIKYKSMFILLGPIKIIPFSFINIHFYNLNSMFIYHLFLSLMTIITGAVLGNNFTNISKMLGSSSISHTGWILIGFLVGGGMIYFLMYNMSFLMFIISMNSLSWENSIYLLSLSGLPPFPLFFSKLIVLFYVLLKTNYFCVIILILSAIFSLNFYLKFSYMMKLYFSEIKKKIFYFMWVGFFLMGFGMIFMFI